MTTGFGGTFVISWSQADLTSLADADRMRLLAMFPVLDYVPHLYSASARRALSTSEAAILLHEAA